MLLGSRPSLWWQHRLVRSVRSLGGSSARGEGIFLAVGPLGEAGKKVERDPKEIEDLRISAALLAELVAGSTSKT